MMNEQAQKTHFGLRRQITLITDMKSLAMTNDATGRLGKADNVLQNSVCYLDLGS